MVKNLYAIQEVRVQSLDHEDTLEKEMATHASIPALEIPQTNAMDWQATFLWGCKRVRCNLINIRQV